MKYIIWDKDDNPLTAKVQGLDSDYFKTYVIPNLKPANEMDYIEGFSAILHTAARWSYILFDDKCYWLIEWNPGLIVLELQSKEIINFTALRSPIPHFGGRKPLEIDNEDDYDEDAKNHQYNLIFRAWDAQFDKKDQQWNNFKPASEVELELFRNCLKYVDKLGDITKSRFENDYKNYLKMAKQNIDKLAGIGILTK